MSLSKCISEPDLQLFSNEFHVDIATIKAVWLVESAGKGFLNSGKPKILFEGHIFWNQLKARGINPLTLIKNTNSDILYKNYTKNYYAGGENEYVRLYRAKKLIPNNKLVIDAANASTSWGAFQIMGYHALPLGYTSIDEFVSKMHLNEKEQLMAFGKYLIKYGLISYLRNKQWANFAMSYNGKAYKLNKYDEKLESAYLKFA